VVTLDATALATASVTARHAATIRPLHIPDDDQDLIATGDP
jgi:hypothetical protein